MWYKINVSFNGKHLFATAKYSLASPWEAVELYELFIQKFRHEDGYNVDMTKWEEVGMSCDVKEMLEQYPSRRKDLI